MVTPPEIVDDLGRWNAWSLYWLAWLLVGFLIPEIYALCTNVRNTLSFQVWRAEGTGQTCVRYFVAVFLLWLLIHMVWRRFT